MRMMRTMPPISGEDAALTTPRRARISLSRRPAPASTCCATNCSGIAGWRAGIESGFLARERRIVALHDGGRAPRCSGIALSRRRPSARPVRRGVAARAGRAGWRPRGRSPPTTCWVRSSGSGGRGSEPTRRASSRRQAHPMDADGASRAFADGRGHVVRLALEVGSTIRLPKDRHEKILPFWIIVAPVSGRRRLHHGLYEDHDDGEPAARPRQQAVATGAPPAGARISGARCDRCATRDSPWRAAATERTRSASSVRPAIFARQRRRTPRSRGRRRGGVTGWMRRGLRDRRAGGRSCAR